MTIESFQPWYEGSTTTTTIGHPNAVIGDSDLLHSTGDPHILPCSYLTCVQSSSWAPKLAPTANFVSRETLQPVTSLYEEPTDAVYGAIGFKNAEGYVISPLNANQVCVCPNSVPFINQVLTWVDAKIAKGSRGCLLDNGSGAGWAGYSGEVCQSKLHEHKHPGYTVEQAFLYLAGRISAKLKANYAGSLVLGNDDVPGMTDAYEAFLSYRLWEGFLYNLPHKPMTPALWQQVFAQALRRTGKVACLSYPPDKDSAYLAFATAKLFGSNGGWPFAHNLGIKNVVSGHGPVAPELNTLRLGSPTALGFTSQDGLFFWRRYNKGVVMVNVASASRPVDWQELGGFIDRPFDVYSGQVVTSVTLRPLSGRVITWS